MQQLLTINVSLLSLRMKVLPIHIWDCRHSSFRFKYNKFDSHLYAKRISLFLSPQRIMVRVKWLVIIELHRKAIGFKKGNNSNCKSNHRECRVRWEEIFPGNLSEFLERLRALLWKDKQVIIYHYFRFSFWYYIGHFRPLLSLLFITLCWQYTDLWFHSLAPFHYQCHSISFFP